MSCASRHPAAAGSATADLLVLSYFGRAEGGAILDRLARPLPCPVHVGTYGIDRQFAAALAELPGTVYSPIFTIQPGVFWKGRRLPADEAARLPASRYEGAIPELTALLAEPAQIRRGWGMELGRRFRDSLRRAPQTSWQFDEVVSQVATDRAWRDVIRGVLDGLALGRQRLGDTPQRGIVWWAANAFPLAAAPMNHELGQFWQSNDRATSLLAGEEYPDFTGDASKSARAHDSFRRELLRAGPSRRSLGQRYLAGLSPGVELRKGLGGNVDGLGEAALRKWRKSYVAQRAADGVQGIAYFDFRARNAGETRAVLGELV
jgi:hypothetical protein